MASKRKWKKRLKRLERNFILAEEEAVHDEQRYARKISKLGLRNAAIMVQVHEVRSLARAMVDDRANPVAVDQGLNALAAWLINSAHLDSPEYSLCEDEGCPQHGTEHVCNPGKD